MAGPNTRVETADLEAADWHQRLGARRVSTDTLDAFFAWRADPANAEAYGRVERVWAASGALAGDPEIRAAVAEAMDRGRPARARHRSPRILFGAAAATAGLLLGLAGWVWVDGRGRTATAVGEQREMELADGSRVRLDTGSSVRVRFEDGVRRVELERGQALFTVAHDAGRPFVVEADGTRVTAVGTVFDVRRLDKGVRVTLVSGAVDVAREGEGAPSRMRAGQQATVTGAGVRTREVDVSAATSWTAGRIVFEDVRLDAAVAEVNRYLEDPIVLEAAGLEGTPVNGVFRTGDREAFASAAAHGLGLGTRVRADGSLVLSRRTKN